MSAPASPNPGAFGIEKAVVIITTTGIALVAAIHATGWLLAIVTSNPSPRFTISRAVAAIGLQPYVPGVHPGIHAATLVFVAAIATVAVMRIQRHRRYRATAAKHRANAFDARDGWAAREAVQRAASPRALMALAPTLRPALQDPAVADVGYYLGTSRGQDVWASCERSILVVGPPGSGKGLHLAINAILDAPGAVITTSTKPDNIKATLTARARLGPVGVFDPQGMLGATFEHLVAWDPIAGCEDPIRAATRAEALAANTGIAATGENAAWRGR